MFVLFSFRHCSAKSFCTCRMFLWRVSQHVTLMGGCRLSVSSRHLAQGQDKMNVLYLTAARNAILSSRINSSRYPLDSLQIHRFLHVYFLSVLAAVYTSWQQQFDRQIIRHGIVIGPCRSVESYQKMSWCGLSSERVVLWIFTGTCLALDCYRNISCCG